MEKVNRKELNDFTNKIFGTDEEIQEGMKEPGKPKITESVMIAGTLFSKNKWVIEKVEK